VGHFRRKLIHHPVSASSDSLCPPAAGGPTQTTAILNEMAHCLCPHPGVTGALEFFGPRKLKRI